jgi:SAM-dependent methyltransferase
MDVRTLRAAAGNAARYASPRWYFKHRNGVNGPHGRPAAPWANAVLREHSQVEDCLAQLQALGLPPSKDTPKNWDALAALDLILKSTARGARVFDAGGERYSMILPWLWLYGYRHLIAGNLAFTARARLGPIVYEPADITRTRYPDGRFDAVTCLSVIEHGVDLERYFSEMARIIVPGGLLVTSTDYWPTPVDTRGQRAYGVPIHIFTRSEITDALALARRCGFEPLATPQLDADEPVVHWQPYDLHYTFAIFSLRKLH